MSRNRLSSLALLLFLAALMAPGTLLAQGVLVHISPIRPVPLPRPIVIPQPRPEPTGSYKVESLDVGVAITDQVAKVEVSQVFKNTGSTQMEVSFVFPLPYDGAVDRLTLMVDGKEYEAKLLPKEEARKLYEEIVRKNKDPALLEWMGSGLFRTSVFPVPAGATRTVNLRYTQVCRHSQGLTDFLFPLRTARYTTGPLDRVEFRVAIESKGEIKNVYSVSHEVAIERSGKNRAVVTYEAKDEIPSEDFRLFYDAHSQGVGASVISYRPDEDQPGYFLLLASPSIEAESQERPRKTVVFVVDRSGSMSGEKFEQARGALKFVLNNLREGDTFNIVAYDSQVESFLPELEKFNDQTREEALGYVEGLYPGGSTNISGALERALGMLKDKKRPTYIVFLTDGIPTAGETKEMKIVEKSKSQNEVRARLFAFGVGYDVNSRLIDRLVNGHFGQSEYVRPNEDIERSVSKLYNRIGSPVLTHVELEFDVEGAKTADGPMVKQIYPAGEFDLFAGDQAVIVGRYAKGGDAKVTLKGKVGDKEESYDFPAKLTEESNDDSNAFVARLWAARRVGEIIDQLDLEGRNEELEKELVELATRHGILTQYTSFLADEDGSNFRDTAGNAARTQGEAAEALSATDGQFGFSQRSAKSSFRKLERATPAFAQGLGGGGGRELSAAERQSQVAARARGNVQYYDARSDRSVVAKNILQVGRKTFFRQGERWVDSQVSEEEEAAAEKIERFGQRYFDLIEEHGPHVAGYLALDEGVVVKLGGKVYTW